MFQPWNRRRTKPRAGSPRGLALGLRRCCRFGAMAGFALICIATETLAQPTPSSTERIIREFIQAAVGEEAVRMSGWHLSRWESPIRVHLLGDADRFGPFISNHMSMLGNLTGLDIQF